MKYYLAMKKMWNVYAYYNMDGLTKLTSDERSQLQSMVQWLISFLYNSHNRQIYREQELAGIWNYSQGILVHFGDKSIIKLIASYVVTCGAGIPFGD